MDKSKNKPACSKIIDWNKKDLGRYLPKSSCCVEISKSVVFVIPVIYTAVICRGRGCLYSTTEFIFIYDDRHYM